MIFFFNFSSQLYVVTPQLTQTDRSDEGHNIPDGSNERSQHMFLCRINKNYP